MTSVGDPPLDEKVVLISRTFRRRRIAHAFGGALALAYYAEPRATVDIDVNVFVGARGADRVLSALGSLSVDTDGDVFRERVRRDGQVRVPWGLTPVDLFFAHDAFHESCRKRIREVPFGDERIRILGPEDLVVFKAVFDRRKDWIDIEQILVTTAGGFDAAYALGWLERIVGPRDHRVSHLRDTVAGLLGR